MPIKVLIADDHQLFREGLVNLLADASNIEVVAQAENGLVVLEKVRFSEPDIVLMDIGMPLLNGINTTIELRKEFPNVKTIALSMHDEKLYVKGILEAGAWGYLLKNCTYDQLVDAINKVYNGEKYLDTHATKIIIQDYLKNDSWGMMKLTERELEVLKLLAEGKSIREISEALFISIKTVGSHKQNIFDKLKLKNMAQLIKFALKNDIVSL